MKKLLAVVLMVMVLPCTGYALEVTVTGPGIGENVAWTGGSGSGSGFAGTIITSIGDVYCVQLGQTVAAGGVYDYTEITPTGNYIAAAWLLNQFGASANTPDEAAGLQTAIWDVIYGAGFNLTGPSAVQIIQTNYLAALPTDPTLPPGYIVLYNKDSQDLLITRVPEPMTMILFGLGLIGLAALTRKE